MIIKVTQDHINDGERDELCHNFDTEKAVPYRTEEFIMRAMRSVAAEASPDNLAELKRVLSIAEGYNADSKDLYKLTKQALESQNACNPRPISLLLHYAIGATMEDGGNPAFEESPLVRLYLNTLLNIIKYNTLVRAGLLATGEPLPQYERELSMYRRDVAALEAYAQQLERGL